MKTFINYIIFLISVFHFESCKKFVEVAPPADKLVSKTVFESDGTATAAVVGIYSDMSSGSTFAGGSYSSVTLNCGLSSDELVNYSTAGFQIQFYENAILRTNPTIQTSLWKAPYKYIYSANSILEGVAASKQLSDAVRTELTGEAEFIRAFCYFYLVNMFGDVPIVTTTDYVKNDTISRSPVDQVYLQIINDLLDATGKLPPDYSISAGERIRPNKWAAAALLSRAYLFSGNWEKAEEQSSAVLNNSDLYSLESDLNAVFLANSQEAIWQLQPVGAQTYTNEGNMFILTGIPTTSALYDGLVGDFEPGDQRRVDWVGSFTGSSQTYYFPYKYKVQSAATLTEYSMVLRLAELYLIRAEARVNLGKLSDAADDINVIRNRANLPDTDSTTSGSLLNAIENERRFELFSEWGHRWFDLKRLNKADETLTPLKPLWKPTSVLYPIPQIDIQNDRNLKQNPGY